VILELLGLIKLFIQEKEDNSLTKMAGTAAELITAAVHKASGMIKACGSEGADQLSGRRALLEYIVNTVEVSFYSFMVSFRDAFSYSDVALNGGTAVE
jgi:hypothetical protein